MMKPILWVLKMEGMLKKSLLHAVSYASGFSVRSDGVIVTCAHVLNQYSICMISARTLDEEDFTHETTVLYEHPSWDMLLLRVQGINDCDFGELAVDGTVSEKETLFHLGNPLEFVGSFMIGHACYRCVEDVNLTIPGVSATCATYVPDALAKTPPYRIMGHICNKEVFDALELKGIDCTYYKNLSPYVPIIQCNGFICTEGCSGGPIFNTRGEIVGMLIGQADQYNYGSHVTGLREFVKFGLEREKEIASDGNPKGKGNMQYQADTSQVYSKRLKR